MLQIYLNNIDIVQTRKYNHIDNPELKVVYFSCNQEGIAIKQMPILTFENISYQSVTVGFDDITIVI